MKSFGGSPLRQGFLILRRVWLALATRMRRLRIGGSLTTLTGTGIGAAFAFFSAVVAARALSLPEFAAFGVGLAVHSLTIQLADVGLGFVAVTETTRGWEASTAEVTQARIRALGYRRLLWSMIIASALSFIALQIPDLGEYRDAVLIGCGGAVLAGLQMFLVAVLQSAGMFGGAGASQALTGLVRTVLAVGCAAAGLGFTPMMLAYAVVAPAVGAVFALWMLYRRRGGRTASSRDRSPMDPRMARAMVVAFVAAALTNNVDVLMLVMYGDQDAVAVYVAAWRIAAGVLLVGSAFAAGLLPSVMQADDLAAELRRLLRIGSAVTVGFLAATPVIAVVGLALLGDAGDGGEIALVLLVVAFALRAFVQIVGLFYLRIRKPWVLATVALAELAIMVSVTSLLLPLGPNAPALGQAAAALVGVIAILIPIVAKPTVFRPAGQRTLLPKPDGPRA